MNQPAHLGVPFGPFETFEGKRLYSNKLLVVAGPQIAVKRSWRERLLTRPWRPLQATKLVAGPMLPDPNVYEMPDVRTEMLAQAYHMGADRRAKLPKVLVAHPETVARLKAALQEKYHGSS